MDDTRSAASDQTPAKSYLTFEEFSQLKGLSLSTLRRRVKDGTIPHFQPGGARTRVLFPADALEKTVEPPNPTPEPASKAPTPRGPKPRWQR